MDPDLGEKKQKANAYLRYSGIAFQMAAVVALAISLESGWIRNFLYPNLFLLLSWYFYFSVAICTNFIWNWTRRNELFYPISWPPIDCKYTVVVLYVFCSLNSWIETIFRPKFLQHMYVFGNEYYLICSSGIRFSIKTNKFLSLSHLVICWCVCWAQLFYSWFIEIFVYQPIANLLFLSW